MTWRVLGLLAAGLAIAGSGTVRAAEEKAAETPPAQDQPKPRLDIYGFAMLDMGYQSGANDPDWFDVVRPVKLPSFENEFGAEGNFFFEDNPYHWASVIKAKRIGFVDKVICHQVGHANRDAILKTIGVPQDRDFSTYETLGNMGTVSLPLTSALADERAGLLPIGQARLLELARAIVDNPTLLLLDEPTSGLGEAEAAVTASVIHDMRASGVSVLLVEHDMPFVMSMCDVVTVLELGSVIAEGTPADVQSDDAVRLAYLG